jgi:hypothetical protein
MKGIGKAFARCVCPSAMRYYTCTKPIRTPFAVTSKIGMSKSEHDLVFFVSSGAHWLRLPPESTDPEFDDFQRNFAVLETATEKFLKDTKAFTDAVNSMRPLASSSRTAFLITLHQHFSQQEVASHSTFPSSSIPSPRSTISWGSFQRPNTRSRTSMPIRRL